MAPLRLAFIAPGNSIHTRRWLEFFARRGHTVGLVSYGPLAEPIEGSNVLLELSELGQGGGPMRGASALLRAIPRIRSALDDFEPQLVHAHFLTGPGWLGLACGRRPLVLSGWGSDVLVDTANPVVRLLHRATVRRAAAATCDARAVAEGLVRLGMDPARVHVILWGVETAQFLPHGPTAARRYELPDNGFVVLAIRGVREVQNPLTIVRAFARFAAVRPDAVLGLMLGPEIGRLPERLAAAIADLGIGDRIRAIPSVKHDELPELYRAADVCVSVPSSDGTSIAVLEAMASGRAVVVSDLEPNRELMREGEIGLIVPARTTGRSLPHSNR